MSTADDTPQSADPFDALLGRAVRLTPVSVAEGPALSFGSELCDGRFEVLRRIGAGGMGVVHEAQDRHRGKRVALKSLARLDAAGIARLKNEFRALADVIHPNLVRLHDLHADGRLWLFSMELIVGEPFDVWVRPGGRLDPARLRAAIAQLLAGVGAIHAAGKLHLDLKPDNVLVQPDGRVVVLDFGLVADPDPDPMDGSIGQTAPVDTVCGTPAYMSPEQTLGDRTTAASDLYQVGVMLFEGLAGQLPFTGSARSIMEHKRERAAPSVATLASDGPRDLLALCDQLLERDPARRPSREHLAAVLSPAGCERPRAPARQDAPATALVGREAELSILRQAHLDAARGTPTVVTITAESGLGKTALVESFLSELRAQGAAVVLSGRCYERENVPYKGFDRLVDSLTRYLRGIPQSEAAALLPRDAHALARVFPVMAQVAAIANAPPAPVADEWELRRRAWDALVQLLARIRERQPLVLHIDDLQWSDKDSTLLMEHLLAHPKAAALLIILCRRDAGGPPPVASMTATRSRQLRLAPLGSEAARRMATQLLADMPDAAQLATAVQQEAEGNPFLISELAWSLLHATAGLPAEAVSLDEAILARTRPLSQTALGLLQLIAVSGRPVPVPVVVSAARVQDDPHGELDLMCTMQLVHRGRKGMLECNHDRIRTAVETRLGAEDRRALHARLAQAWTSVDNPDPEVLFEHHHGAGSIPQAGLSAVDAAQKAARGLAFDRAAMFYRRAIELLPPAQVDSLALHDRLGAVLSLGGRWGEAGRAFSQAAQRASGAAQRAHFAQHAARHLLGSGNSRDGLPMLRRAFSSLGVAWPRTELSALCRALLSLLWLRIVGARYRLVDAAVPPRFDGLASAVVDPEAADGSAWPTEMMVVEGLLDGAGLVPAYDFARGTYYVTAFIRRALSWGERSKVAVALGMLSTMMSTSRLTQRFGLRLASEAETLARSGAEPPLAAAALGFVGFTRMVDGQLEQAYALGAEGAELVAGSGRAHTYQRWAAQGLQGCALMLLGRVGEAARLSDAIGREASDLGDEMAKVGGEAVIARLLRDDIAGAEALLAHKRSVLGQVGDRGVLHQIVLFERVCNKLYCGRGREALALIPSRRSVVVTPFDSSALEANCALQVMADATTPAPERRRMFGVVRRARRALARAPGPLNAGIIPQLDAGLCLQRGDVDAATALLEQSAASYAAAGMALHAHMMRWRRGRLVGDWQGRAQATEAEAFMRDQGVVNPQRWAELMAAGLGPPANR